MSTLCGVLELFYLHFISKGSYNPHQDDLIHWIIIIKLVIQRTRSRTLIFEHTQIRTHSDSFINFMRFIF